MAQNKAENRIEWLDALRGLALLIVYFAHVIARYASTEKYSHGVGKIGVWFFMLSAGYLLLMRLPEKLDGRWLLGYYIGKFFRLFPCLVVGAFLVYREDIRHSAKEILQTVFFLKGPQHLWYIPVLAVFYLVAPLVILTDRFVKNRAVLAGICILFGTAFALIYPFTEYPENSIALKWYLPVFLMGILLWYVTHLTENTGKRGEKAISGGGNRKKCWAFWDGLALIAAFTIVALTPAVTCGLFHSGNTRFLPNKYLLIGGLWFLILLGLINGKAGRRILEKCRPLVWLSRISYPMYIVHYPIIAILKKKWEPGGLTMLPAAFMVSLVLSVILHYVLEKPADKLGKKIRSYLMSRKRI